ncbi:hypothetical protein JRQ81_019315, partial [Phrynocephalus forsythii]
KCLCKCLLCHRVLNIDAMKPSELEDHLRRCYPDKRDKDLTYFKTLKEKLQKRATVDTMFTSTSKRDYNILQLITKSGKPHTIREELILPAIEGLKTVLHKPAYDILKRIPLSNNTVQRCIDEMSCHVQIFLCNYLKTNNFFIQLDESTLPGNEAQLLAYVHF